MDNQVDLLAQAKSLHHAGQVGEAETRYREILSAAPDHLEALFLLGVASDAQGRPDEAIELLQHALRVQPDLAEAHNYLGAVFAEQRRLDEAITHFQHACRLRPESAEPSQNLCSALADRHNDQGLMHFHAGNLEAARLSFQQALEVKPECFAAHGNLGNLFLSAGNYEEAARCYQRVLQIEPQSAEAHYNLGQIAKNQIRLDDAVNHYRRALAIRPEYKEARFELAFAQVHLNQIDAGAACYEEALTRNPSDADAHFGHAVIRLLQGRYAEGWPEYEWRFLRAGMAQPTLRVERWTGQPLAGKSVLVRSEQGLGDVLQFVRYAALLKQMGARVTVECRRPLESLIQRAQGVDGVVAPGQELPPLDYQVPLLSLPGLLGTRLETIPAAVPYLSISPDHVAQWRDQFAALEAGTPRPFRVGIAWQGSPGHAADCFRSIPLPQFRTITAVPGVRIYSLQFGPGREQLTEAMPSLPITDLGDRLGDFHNTGAALANLDLVIACDSAVVHLAGALGLPAWVALAQVPDWRWLMDREDSPWYPSVRLFRQTRLGSWQEPLTRIAAELTAKVRSAASTPR